MQMNKYSLTGMSKLYLCKINYSPESPMLNLNEKQEVKEQEERRKEKKRKYENRIRLTESLQNGENYTCGGTTSTANLVSVTLPIASSPRE